MNSFDRDPVLTDLAALPMDAPDGLLDRIATRWSRVGAPIGELAVAFTRRGIAFVRPDDADFAPAFRQRFARPLLPAPAVPDGLAEALSTGDGTDLDVDLDAAGEFQRSVLEATRSIPVGQVRPYAWVAAEIGRPKAVRAVGTALATNPVPLVIPCHRVVRTDGSLGQYIFGPDTKRELLKREHADV
ncbi:MAG TPA: MGMT family protein [Stackebrandtia sp.]|jgi:methylated-DNA-[protein]-cysteine S-methyltransferase|uniref:methylated-DNA--[protein]-cysteine S-methyltransferase n=1 Tax=Stackebrandtia sp. TaxID=2023065 RepID=UPI002D66F7F2|nr:MGMT family protein [Stackebrandtia sp.]HZE39684.1 MGMT family protein [Stackebrandtia sp.]